MHENIRYELKKEKEKLNLGADKNCGAHRFAINILQYLNTVNALVSCFSFSSFLFKLHI